jgi:alpha-N-arabinofuranosidase
LSLVGASSGIVYGSENITVNSVAGSFTSVETGFLSTGSPDGNNVWQLTFDGSTAAGGALWFSLVQLFPVTYHARFVCIFLVLYRLVDNFRYNGIRLDVGNFLEDMNPSFLRFPGGNNLWVFPTCQQGPAKSKQGGSFSRR